MAIIGVDRFHHGKVPGPLGVRPPPGMDHGGGLNLSGSEGPFRSQIELALDQIARARLPDGSRPVLVGCLEFVRKTLTVRTNVLFGELPLGQTSAKPRWDADGHLTIDIRISRLDLIGTRERKPGPATHGHAAVPGHPALPALYSDGSPRTLETTLVHEVGHAARIIRHETFPDYLVEERLVSNLENQYRFARGIAQRKLYGEMELKQYR